MRHLVSLTVLCALMFAGPPVDANGLIPEFIPLGDLAGGDYRSVAWAISGDGEVVVGESISADGTEAFRWTRAGGMVGLGDLPGGNFSSAAYAVDTDGDVIVGSSQSADSAPVGQEAFRWTAAGGMEPLGDLPGGFYASAARGVSGDGTVVAGHSTSLAALFNAMWWNPTDGMQSLSDLPTGPNYSTVNAVSRDGMAIFGQGQDDEGTWGVKWVDEIPYRLPAFTIGVANPGGNALDGSADGSWAVGSANTDLGTRAVRYTPQGGVETLGSLGGTGIGNDYSIATACSADAAVIVGSVTTSAGPEAFVWTEADGMRRLTDVLDDLGVTGLGGWRLFMAHGVSDDGKVIVGSGINPSGDEEGWVAILGDPPEVEPQGLLLTRVTVKVNTGNPAKSSVKVEGLCDQGVWLGNDLTKPLDLEVGDLELSTGELAPAANGRSYRYRGGGIDMKLTPSRKGSSATKFRLVYKGDLGGKVITGGTIGFEMRGPWVIASGTVRLVAGKYAWNRQPGPGALETPFCHLAKATVKLGADRAKQLKLTSGLAPGGAIPGAAPEVTIEFRGWKATVPAAKFTRESWGYRFRGDENGLKKLDLDYLNRESIVLKAADIDLGPFAEGPNNIEVKITMGAVERTMTVRVVRKGRKVQY